MQKYLYWICQIGGWGFYSAFLLSMMYIFGGMDIINRDVIALQVFLFLALILFSHLYRLYFKSRNWISMPAFKLVPRMILGSVATSILAQAALHVVIYWIFPLKDISPFSLTNFVGYALNTFIVLFLWSSIYFSIKSVQRNRRSEIEKLELKTALQEAELMVLKNQINPHFLFNALNNIRSLILSDPEKARKMVTHISDLLRYSIQFNSSEKVTLAQEIEIVKDYLQLESIQFDERLNYSFNVSEESLEVKVPPMALQLLVENAIKHGLSIKKEGGSIHIESSMNGEAMMLKVTNDGQFEETSKREGIGLKNLVERMKILFGPFAEFHLENSSDTTITATLKIPVS